MFKNYQSVKLFNNDHRTRIYLTPELCKKKKKYLRTIMFLVLLSFVFCFCFFFVKSKKVKYGKQRDENRTEIYSKNY